MNISKGLLLPLLLAVPLVMVMTQKLRLEPHRRVSASAPVPRMVTRRQSNEAPVPSAAMIDPFLQAAYDPQAGDFQDDSSGNSGMGPTERPSIVRSMPEAGDLPTMPGPIQMTQDMATALSRMSVDPKALQALATQLMQNPALVDAVNKLSPADLSGLPHGALPLAPGAPANPNAPLKPGKPILDKIGAGFEAVATLMMLKAIFPMLLNPAVVLQFTSPKMMTINYPQLPAVYREPSEDGPDYFHPYGNWGDYGYENMGYQGYGTGKSGCAPWWWQWTKKNKMWAPFSKTSPLSS